jgi:hypothetical protein
MNRSERMTAARVRAYVRQLDAAASDLEHVLVAKFGDTVCDFDEWCELFGCLRWSCPLHPSPKPYQIEKNFSQDGEGCMLCAADEKASHTRGRRPGGGRSAKEEKLARIAREMRRYKTRRKFGQCVRCMAPSPIHNECDTCRSRRQRRRRARSSTSSQHTRLRTVHD